MSYLVIARKYRPSTFEEVIGQEHVTKTLINSINQDKVHHAYIFTGPRGVGKTTVSRVLAKALNCETGITATPCGVCKNCKEIEIGSSLDIKEIDGASNRGIDEIRDLRDDIKFSPASCRKKIYIIDEVHMLTNAAFNALLKTLEEPPPHALFIFATTEINDVPATILSRCQRHDFRRVDIDVLTDSLKAICQKEKIKIDEESLLMIARNGDGSVRDCQSVLDQVIAYSGDEITGKSTAEALGIPDFELYFKFLDILHKKDSRKLLIYIDKTLNEGTNLLAFFKGLLEFFRNLLISRATSDDIVLPLTTDNIKRLQKYNKSFEEIDLLYFLDIISKGLVSLKKSSLQRIDFEIILLKILHYEPAAKLDELIHKLSLLEGEGEVDAALLKDDIINDIMKNQETKGIKGKIKTESKIDKKIAVEKEENKEEIIDQKKTDDKILDEKKDDQKNEILDNPILDSQDNIKDENTTTSDSTANIQSVDDGNNNSELTETPKEPISENDNNIEKEVHSLDQQKKNILIDQSTKQDDSLSKNDTELKKEINLNLIKENWMDLSSNISEKIVMLGKSWEYCVPLDFKNNILRCKVSKKHITFKEILQKQNIELNKILNEFFKRTSNDDKIIVKFEISEISEDERFFKIKVEEKEKTPEQKQKELLEQDPQLQFLFEDDIAAKVVK